MKLSAHYETEAYMTAGGYYAIKQEDPMGNDPSVVLLKPDQLRALIKDMTAALERPALFEAEEGAE